MAIRRVWLALRHDNHYRADAFRAGLKACGYTVEHGVTYHPGPRDALLIWNRYGSGAQAADRFDRLGLPVWVAENAAWGNDFAGDRWYSLARNWHNKVGSFDVGGHERWDSINTRLSPWRTSGEETVILPQRGIGPKGVAMPHGWAEKVQAEHGGRIRRHPGKREGKPLRDDLAKARMVRTWGSGAAVKALLWGIPVKSDMPEWIGGQDNTNEGRLAMFRRLAWGQWRIDEVVSGEPFARLAGAA